MSAYEIPNLRHLRAFLEVARHKSVSAASDHVHLSQPAITQAIAKLETSLGVSLFDRRTEGMFTTEVGKLFLQRVERMQAYLHNGAAEALRRSGKRGSKGFGNFDQLLTAVQLRALAAMSDAENFSLAARAVGISQPSIHRAARDLERLSGVTLFNKTSQGIELTPSAKALAQQTKLAFAELEQGFIEIQEWLGRDIAHIRVGSMPLARTFVLPKAINSLIEEKPDVQVSIVDGPYEDLLHGLRHGELDVLIGALRYPIPIDDVEQEALFQAPLAVVSRAYHPLTKQEGMTTEDLTQYPWVVPREGAPTRTYFNNMFLKCRAKPTDIIESNSLVLIRSLLLDSDRLALISAHQIYHEENLGLLKRLPIDLSDSWRDIGITVRKGWRPTVTQQLFLDLLRRAGQLVS